MGVWDWVVVGVLFGNVVMWVGAAQRQLDRRLRRTTAVLCRRLGLDPSAVEADLRRVEATEARAEADADARASVQARAESEVLRARSAGWGLVSSPVGAGVGGLAGWLVEPTVAAAAVGVGLGTLTGYVLGTFAYGLREGMRG